MTTAGKKGGYPAASFESHIERRGACRIWTGATFKIGGFVYGKVRWGRTHRQAHRVAWEMEHGQALPPRLNLRNGCGNTLCVEPSHWRQSLPRTTFREVLRESLAIHDGRGAA